MAIRADDQVNCHIISILQANAREPLASLARIEQPDVWKFGTPLISHPLLSK